ncbi:hypothetical protein XENOCAPTIV_006427 [Xenoophorus captivus]|uniref:Uncharacterized protein n=1 Tax=Xenoophorus captivus TaxID=1517983 RepID=A0ABV0Q8D1_9TELE
MPGMYRTVLLVFSVPLLVHVLPLSGLTTTTTPVQIGQAEVWQSGSDKSAAIVNQETLPPLHSAVWQGVHSRVNDCKFRQALQQILRESNPTPGPGDHPPILT